ncbi:hypothetical protein IQ264_09980 [Phormidium sp. LEGE 05292]|uniref:hypothetical protein n=1 Tax=[Phormidium] sp. LEGE 05292 TaxID=767427 RepID=UPI0018829C7C|nr:hypothetical protein [Phormidium sp. LEGE 05292]MBE9225750.1 hypothetical protein [Phormidium sp. LEGE 05292]
MASQTRGSGCFPSFYSQAKQELLQVLLQNEEESVYYWNPTEQDADCYFAQLEKTFQLDDWIEEVEEKAQSFYNQLDAIWAIDVPQLGAEDIFAILQQKFAFRVPSAWLKTISHKACQLKFGKERADNQMNLADQLVCCVQELLPNWPEGDLYLFSRPLAFAMRGTETAVIDSMIATIRELPFSDLSDVEQARLGLAIARYALAELDHE